MQIKYLLPSLFAIISLFSFSGISQFTPEQELRIDSLNTVINNPLSHDTSLVGSYIVLSEIIYMTKLDSLRYLCEKARGISEEALIKTTNKKEIAALRKYLAAALNNIGYVYQLQGDIEKVMIYYNKSMKIQEEDGNKHGLAMSLNNIGFLYLNQGQIQVGLEYFLKSLKIQEEIDDKPGMALTLNNIGMLYLNQEQIEKALLYYSQSLDIHEIINDKKGLALNLNNIGYVYQLKGEFEKSLEYHHRSMEIKKDLDDKMGVAMSLNNIGHIYQSKGDFEKALDYYNKSIEIRKEINDKTGVANSLNNIGNIYFRLNNFVKAKNYLDKGLALAQELGYPNQIKEISSILFKIAEKEGRWYDAFEMFKLHITMRDSVSNEENFKTSVQQNAKYEYEKQAAADSIVNAEAEKIQSAKLTAEKAENKRQQHQKYYLFGGLTLALIFGGVVFNRFRTTRKQKGIIEKQKETVDKAFEELAEKNTEILDSINYAKRIQSAILPPSKLVKKYLATSFIHYKPKDIVAGDFYWMEPTNDGVLFAAADCTGHGVPGAMVSVVCNNGLNRSVREFGLTDPGGILNKTREIVIQEFEKSEDEVKDGMDIALCALHAHSPTHSVLYYAGAHNPLWIIRKGAKEIEEIKANKQPIGQFLEPKPYTTHKVELNSGDSIYIFSDGYPDQFGGEKGKKFKSANFKKLLLSIQNETMEAQEKILDKAFEEWRGNLEQIDDVCIIGVRI